MGEDDAQVRGLIIPGGLVHAHVHLDKCFLLGETPIGDGSFQEALTRTSNAKKAFTREDLIERGSRLITASLQYGVLVMRAFVEVDLTVGLLCLEAGLELQKRFRHHCTVQLVIFAQDPLLDRKDASKQKRMLDLFEQACQLTNEGTVLGSTPYVQDNYKDQCDNIRKLFDLAATYNRNVDFHLDYNLEAEAKPLIWFVLEEAHRRSWKRLITIGHATRLSLFDDEEWDRLASQCQDLKVAFIALPPSDLYMQGRQSPYKSRTRATLPLLELEKRGLVCALAVNNVANLFTPQGDGDPLALMPLMVGLWQDATPRVLHALLAMVSQSASEAIVGKARISEPKVGTVTVSSDGSASTEIDPGAKDYTLLVQCDSVQDAVLRPPSARLTIKAGKVVAWTKVDAGIAP
ncbi:hypothetical protein CBS101457_004465 [Exobasidium rhododendri]|nr:hypothetical protein CBS101457_004465 [Exobasidium rhododendri]